jgi:hypothetical protein
MKTAIHYTRVPTTHKAPRPTVEMSTEELLMILSVDAAIAQRDTVYHRPTVQIEAVKIPA